ncbi:MULTISPECIES: nuclear transport factor 2 family protein [unclassified Sphingomonas]|jgi:hypothetical protein|uniref:nuclear transport factor 2 family protein n=1 Tax=unclassified Sphingomonas TaxID=196159 RepID=UPI000830BD56|nr:MULTISPECIES: nuclear transport factor 2 family protein [unclassified Sphingomonas]
MPESDPVTAANHLVVAELIRIADAIDRAVDARAWERARSLFAATVHVDFESLSGQPPATIPADALIAAWSSNLRGAKTSFHMRTNHQVTIEGDRATMVSAGYAWNRMEGNGDPLWEVWGDYTHRFARDADGGWRVDGMILRVTHQRGNFWVRDTAPQD